MYDMTGRLVYAPGNEQLLASEPMIIPGDRFPSGCYAIVTKVAGSRRTFKVVIAS